MKLMYKWLRWSLRTIRILVEIGTPIIGGGEFRVFNQSEAYTPENTVLLSRWDTT